MRARKNGKIEDLHHKNHDQIEILKLIGVSLENSNSFIIKQLEI